LWVCLSGAPVRAGTVDRAEFHKAMPKLGFDVPKADIDALFDEWDKGHARPRTRRSQAAAVTAILTMGALMWCYDADGGGSLDYKELSNVLKSRKSTVAIGKMKRASIAAVATT
jgi:hypothetical protein